MSVFLDLLCGLLPLHSVLQVEGNELRKVLDRSIGEYFDGVDDIKEQLFLSSATGSWLDCFGRDFGVPRRLGEGDEEYRERIVFEKLEYLTVGNVMEFYGLDLYAFVSLYNPKVNQLTSDNPYIADRYMSIADKSTQEILDKKFILDNGILWLDGDTGVNRNSIVSVDGKEVLYKYIGVLSATDVREFFL
jgi:hypothetical protein